MLKSLLASLLDSFIKTSTTRQLMSASAYPSNTEVSIPVTGDASDGWAKLAVYTAPCDGVVTVYGTTATTQSTTGICYLSTINSRFQNAVVMPETGGSLKFSVSAIIKKGEQVRIDGDSFVDVSIKFYKSQGSV